MKVISTQSSLPWCNVWTLQVYGRSFYLGQDVKFCHRCLGMGPADVVNIIGSRHIYKKTVNKKLAQFICFSLNITRSNVKQLQNWSLSAD